MKFFTRLFVLILLTFPLTAQQYLFDTILRMKDSVKSENIVNHIKQLQYAGGHRSRVNFTPGNDSASVYLREQFQLLCKNGTVTVDTFYISSAQAPYNTQPLYNITAKITGTQDSLKYYLIGAHYDASASRMGTTVWNQQWRTLKAPGADDNASGVASLLEMIRILSDTANGYRPDYTLKLTAFGAEELGPAYSSNHHGSKYMAAHAADNGQTLLGMISFDMVGYNPNFDFTGVVSNQNSGFLASKLMESQTLFDIDLLMTNFVNSAATYSDHQSFWDAGYQALLVIENAPPWNNGPFYTANPFYHTSSDTLETLNIPLIVKVTQLNLTAFAAFGGRLSTNIEEENIKSVPEDYSLLTVYPNPFNAGARFILNSSTEGTAMVIIYNMLGEAVASEEYQVVKGINNLRLDGRDLRSGTYILVSECNGQAAKGKFIVLK